MKTVVRASSLPQFADCPRRFAARTLAAELIAAGYKINKNMRTSIGAKIGTATHAGAAYLMSEKMKSGEIGNQTEAEHRAMDEFTQSMQEGIIWDDTSPNQSDSQKQLVRMLKVFRHGIAPDIRPFAVETRLEAAFDEDFIVSGQSDLQLLELESIDDLKTGTKPGRHFAQIGSYSLLARTAYPDIHVSKLRVNFIPRVSVNKPQPEAVIEEYNQVVAENAALSTLKQIKHTIDDFRKALKENNMPPEHVFLANPSSMLCSEKYCSAFGTNFCREHKGALQ